MATSLGAVIVFGAVLAIVFGSLMGQPVVFGFVETGSMTPALHPGDGFVAVPSAITGPVHPGDVVVYRAKRLHGGGLTTHRVVGETAAGFVTQGDANPVSDQAGGEPPVRRPQIVAKALQIDGRIVAIPAMGAVVGAVRDGFASLGRALGDLPGVGGPVDTTALVVGLFAASMVAYVLDVLWSRRRRHVDRRRGRGRPTGAYDREIVLGLTLLVVVSTTAAMVVPAGPQEFGFVSSSYDTPGARVVGVGTSETTGLQVVNGGFVPVVAMFEPDGEHISMATTEVQVGPRSSATVNVTLTAPPTTGYYRQYVVEHRYLELLPVGVLRWLYRVHPWTPIAAIDLLVGGAFFLLGTAFLGSRPRRALHRNRPSTFAIVRNRLLP